MMDLQIENIIDAIQTKLQSDYNDIIDEFPSDDVRIPSITQKNVVKYVVDFDKYKSPIEIFILPENEEISYLTQENDDVAFELTVLIVVRSDSEEKLVKKIMRLSGAFKEMIRRDPYINDSVGDSQVNSVEYFHAIEGNPGLKGAEIQLQVSYEE
jgi:hypothetical protein